MKFTDSFFKFPVTLYSGFDLQRDSKTEELLDAPVATEYVIGTARLPIDELLESTWFEAWTKDRTVADVKEYGCNVTIIHTRNFGQFPCLWPIEKFEKKLNEFMEELTSSGSDKNFLE